MPTKMWVIGIGALGILLVVYLAYNHYTGLLEDNTTLRENAAKDEIALDIQRKANDEALGVIEEWRQQSDVMAAVVEEMQRQAEKAERESRRLNDIFSKHDLTALSLAKPGLIERRVNSGVDRVSRMFECETSSSRCGDSGSKPTGETPTATEPQTNRDDESEVDGGDT